jgi:hypothetical protein
VYLVEDVALLGCYAASVGIWLLTFRDNRRFPLNGSSSPRRTNLGDRTDWLSRNDGNKLPTYTTLHSRKAKTSTALLRKPEISYTWFLTHVNKIVKSRSCILSYWIVRLHFNTVVSIWSAALDVHPVYETRNCT